VDALQIVAEPRRRAILRLVWDHERSVSDLARHFEITIGAISQHLAVLREAGYVVVRKAGTQRFYRANPEGLGEMRAVLEAMWTATLDDLAKAIEADNSEEDRRDR
jgi:DNA-binding transcriptional ArsR family regulator